MPQSLGPRYSVPMKTSLFVVSMEGEATIIDALMVDIPLKAVLAPQAGKAKQIEAAGVISGHIAKARDVAIPQNNDSYIKLHE